MRVYARCVPSLFPYFFLLLGICACACVWVCDFCGAPLLFYFTFKFLTLLLSLPPPPLPPPLPFLQDTIVRGCLGTGEDHAAVDGSLVTALVFVLLGILLELYGIFDGVSTFNAHATLFSLVLHAFAAVGYALFVLDNHPSCGIHFWYFAIGTIFPALNELRLVYVIKIRRSY